MSGITLTLNVPGDHPARDMQDTFWIDGKRSKNKHSEKSWSCSAHTTNNMQIRTMEKYVKDNLPIPIAIVCPGKVFPQRSNRRKHMRRNSIRLRCCTLAKTHHCL